MKRIHIVAFLLVFGCSTFETQTKTPQKSTTTHAKLNISDDKIKRLPTWCKEGISVACIDYLHVNPDVAHADINDSKTLLDYCNDGYGSACYYLSAEQPKYKTNACKLAEMRSCPKTIGKLYQTSPISECTRADYEKIAPLQRNQIPNKNLNKTRQEQAELIMYCYYRKLDSKTEYNRVLQGSVKILFSMNETGHFHSPQEVCSSFYDQEISQCIAQALDLLYIKDFDNSEYKSNKNQQFVKSIVFSNHSE